MSFQGPILTLTDICINNNNSCSSLFRSFCVQFFFQKFRIYVRGGCVQGCVGTHPPSPDIGSDEILGTPTTDTWWQPPHVWVASGRYVSYWNSFLLLISFMKFEFVTVGVILRHYVGTLPHIVVHFYLIFNVSFIR